MHFRSRRTALFVSRCFLFTLLFAQFAQAAAPCQVPDSRPAMAFDGKPAPCAGMASPVQCLAQCTAADQVSGYPDLPVAAAPDFAVLLLSAVPAVPELSASLEPPRRSGDPPATIRFCSLLD
jgi:hypothetical protein